MWIKERKGTDFGKIIPGQNMAQTTHPSSQCWEKVLLISAEELKNEERHQTRRSEEDKTKNKMHKGKRGEEREGR